MTEKDRYFAIIQKHWPSYSILSSKTFVKSCVHSFLDNKSVDPVYIEGGSDANMQDIAALVIATCQVVATTLLLYEAIGGNEISSDPLKVEAEISMKFPEYNPEITSEVLNSEEFQSFLNTIRAYPD